MTERYSQDRLEVLILTNLYPTSWQPTRGMYNLQAFRALGRRCNLRVVLPLPWWTRLRTPGGPFATRRESQTGLDTWIASFGALPRFPQFSARGLAVSLGGLVQRLHHERPIDVILASWAYPDAAAAQALATSLGVPVVSMVLGSDVNALAQDPSLRRQIVTALQGSHCVFAVSRALGEAVVALGVPASQVVVQHNGVDPERFSIRSSVEARRELRLPESGQMVLYAGNLVPEKGVDLLIQALAVDPKSSYRLVVVGDGPLRETMMAQAAANGVSQRVHFAGRRPHTEIATWMSAADLFCLPSRREGCPNVVLESLASGRPVVAARVGGVPELLNTANGVVVDPENGAALATGIREALAKTWDPEFLRSTLPCPSWDAFAERLLENLQSAANAHQAVGSPRPKSPHPGV